MMPSSTTADDASAVDNDHRLATGWRSITFCLVRISMNSNSIRLTFRCFAAIVIAVKGTGT